MSKRSLELYRQDILESTKAIQEFVHGMTLQSFETDRKTYSATLREYTVIGEAISKLISQLEAQAPNYPWRMVKDFRNMIVHEYFGVDPEIVWDLTNLELPELKNQIEKIILTSPLSCFKAYDIRGKVPDELNTDLAYAIGRAVVAELGAKRVVVGYDIRLESPALAQSLTAGLTDSGADVIDIGLCGTEEVYFATTHYQVDGGIMITASHNPKGYNGMKLVAAGSRPISNDSGLLAIKARVQAGDFLPVIAKGAAHLKTDKSAYIAHLLTYVDRSKLKPLRIVMNPGNGSAGALIHQLATHLPFTIIPIHDTPDGNFPHGVPNPLLPENRAATAEAVVTHNADFGIAWDGDFDRCFLFDETGAFIEGYYLVGLLAETLLASHPGAKIIHDPRLTWNTIEQVAQAGGVPVQSKTGHAFIKERMRLEDAVYGGEMSAHHYFKTFAYCDSGMIPWLLITQLMSDKDKRLSQLVATRMAAYPCSGEINYTVQDIPTVLERILAHFSSQNPTINRTDGISLEFANWRMNLRASNTEPLLRLNVESRGNQALVWDKVREIEALIKTE
ncbi:HepT-like ribonuclease domain-containing protein [Chrysiogenes arsenatis]|uniref:HepT-like ribonuclease domain-containing protein n=1 Tax=Chrysiogenes arsenatis TaxID=309797 RepID=UPI0004084313|nr:HepT-like ribonuclease domain-containing protein [Chrysiogenes arsenatis]